MAAEFASSAAANAVGHLATEYASSYVSYFFRFGRIVEEFKDQRKQLELKKDRVKNDVDVAIRKTEVIEKDVQEWLKEAEKQLEETRRLEAEIERQKCFNWCPSWGWRFCLSKKVAKKTPYITKLLHRCDFKRVGIRPPLQGIEFFPSKDFKSSKSSNSAFNGIMKALNTNGVNMIGLYGMPGVGKTTLAKEVGRQAKEQMLFDNVVMVTMSQKPIISVIQDKIAGLLGLTFEASFEEGKAEELWRRLKTVQKILIIIDDVWNKFSLLSLGVPFGVEHEGCKILLTTRRRDVCVRMNCKEKFELEILSKDEAWALFKDNAGLKDVSLTLNDVAKEVASKCKGLPLAIVTIGKALNGATLEEWEAVNQRFKESRHVDNEDVCEDIYKCLLVSYDYLKGENIRSCFFLCSLFPEDFHINIELLIMFGIGRGLFSHIYSIERKRREIREELRKLQASGLLLKSEDDDDDVSMHDMVRDFSHWITSKGENMSMVKDGLVEWPVSESFGCYTAISFWNSNINNFPDKMVFSKLEIFVFTGKNFVRVPSALVKGMKNLRILYLKNVTFSLEVFQFVRNLRTLYFENCEIENISSLKIVENLEILALLDTNVYELPEELVALHGLKSLHFSYIGERRSNFPPNLLSRLTSLQELHVTCPNNVNLWELNSLSRLTALSLRVSTDHQCFQENFVFPKLPRYRIALGAYSKLSFMQGLKFKALEIGDFSSSFNAFKELFCNVEKLRLREVMEHKNIVPDVDQEGLNELTSLYLWDCDDMECLMDTTGEKAPTTAFSNLVELNMGNMVCLKELCHGPPPISFLQKLKDMSIQCCTQLKEVFQMDGILEQEEIQTPLLPNLTSLALCSLPKLESIWKVQSTLKYHASLQSLKVVKIESCHKLKSIFSTCVAQSLLRLQQLSIHVCNGLEQVFHFPQEMAELEVPLLSNLTFLQLIYLPELKWIWKGPTHLVNLKSLKTMRIKSCVNLACLFTIPLAQNLVQLEELGIQNCDSLEHVIMEEAENEDEIVSNMNGNSLCWPKLKTLTIDECRSLKYVFPVTSAQGHPYLQSVRILNCPQLKQIFNMTKEKGGNSHQDIVLQSLQILNLENLENLDSFCLVSQPLKEFKLSNCPGLTCFENQQGVVTWQAELKDGIKKFLCNAKKVTMGAVVYPKNLIPNVDPEGLNEVTSLTIEQGKELECLIDTTVQGCVSTIAFFNLEELVIQQTSGFKMLCNGPFPKGFLQKLEKLEARDCMELVPLYPVLQNLKEARVLNCGQLQQVFQTEGLGHDMEENGAKLLSKLTSLELESLPELKWIWKGPTHYVSLQSLKVAKISRCNRLKYLFSPSLTQTLVLLQQLTIEDCNTLEHIITDLEIGDNIETEDGHLHPPLLPKLTTLRIRYCPRLKYGFKIPLGQVLPQLKSVSISKSPQLKHVFNVAKIKNGVDRDAIGLPGLRDLHLRSLTNLNFFCSENFPVVSPSLEKLIVEDCPRLEIFSIQQESNKEVQLKELSLSPCRFYSISGTINCEMNFQIQVGQFISTREDICLKYIHQLQGPIQVASPQYLRELNVSRCSRLKSLFNSVLARNLPQLNILHVEYCDELEEIIEMGQTSGASSPHAHLQPISFPNLEVVRICWCNNLKSLFPISVAHSLSKLRNTEICEAAKIEQVFGYQDELNVEDDQKEIVLPRLKDLKLSNLQNLRSFAAMGYHFRFPSLDHFEVTKCPKLTTSFDMDLEHPGHAITEAPQPTEGVTIVEEIVDNQSSDDIVWRRWDVED